MNRIAKAAVAGTLAVGAGLGLLASPAHALGTNNTYNGSTIVVDTTAFAKAGPGSLVISGCNTCATAGDNTYQGRTVINSGILL